MKFSLQKNKLRRFGQRLRNDGTRDCIEQNHYAKKKERAQNRLFFSEIDTVVAEKKVSAAVQAKVLNTLFCQ